MAALRLLTRLRFGPVPMLKQAVDMAAVYHTIQVHISKTIHTTNLLTVSTTVVKTATNSTAILSH